MLQHLRHVLPDNTRQYREETAQRITWGHWFVLFNVVVALLIASRYAFNADWPNTLFGRLYFFTSLFGHFSFIVFAGYLLLLFPISFLIKNNRTFRGVSVIIATIGQTVLLLDTEVFARFYLHLSPLVWDLLVNPDSGELARQWQLLFTPMPLIVLAEMLYSRWCWQKLRSFNRQRWGKYIAAAFVCCFTATHLIYAWADISFYRPITTQKANYPLSYPMTARSFLEKHGFVDSDSFHQKLEERGQTDAPYLDYPKNALQFSPSSSGVNLLLINISGLRNDVINAEQMPNLTQFSQHTRRFNQHYSGGNSPTAGVVSLFYSLSGNYVDSVLQGRTTAPLIRALQARHYQFGIFSYTGFHNPIYRVLFQDFDLPAANSNRDALNLWKNWLAQRHPSQPFFSYLELGMSNGESTGSAEAYAQRAKLLDRQFAELWQYLESQQATTRTVVIITADAAQLFNGELNENSFAAQKTQVPLLVYWQNEAANYSQLTSHLDIAPTLLKQFFGLKNPTRDYAQGVDLTDSSERKWLLSADRKWTVAIMPDGEQYHIDRKGNFIQFNAQNEKEKADRPPLALFLQMIHQSNEFMDK